VHTGEQLGPFGLRHGPRIARWEALAKGWQNGRVAANLAPRRAPKRRSQRAFPNRKTPQK